MIGVMTIKIKATRAAMPCLRGKFSTENVFRWKYASGTQKIINYIHLIYVCQPSFYEIAQFIFFSLVSCSHFFLEVSHMIKVVLLTQRVAVLASTSTIRIHVNNIEYIPIFITST